MRNYEGFGIQLRTSTVVENGRWADWYWHVLCVSQVFSYLDNTTSLHFHDGTQQATRSEPPGPTMPPQRDIGQSRGDDEGRVTTSCSPLSPISSQVGMRPKQDVETVWRFQSHILLLTSCQGFTDRELLTDEVSGRLCYYNPTTRATSWVAPEPLSPSSPDSPTAIGRHNNSPVRSGTPFHWVLCPHSINDIYAFLGHVGTV